MEEGYNFVNEEICIKRLRKFRTENSVVRKFIGIQSQFYRYAMLCCKFRGDDFDLNRKKYFRAWTIRGTMHIHHIEDYNLVIFKNMLTPYMRDFWNNETLLSIREKEFFCEKILEALRKKNLNKKQLVDLCGSYGMTDAKKEYLFNSWGGLPRYLIETGKIILLCSDDNLFQLAPDIELMNREDAEVKQVKRYLEGYGPCTIEDVMYFFKWSKKKSQIIIKRMSDKYFKSENVVKKVDNRGYIFIPTEDESCEQESLCAGRLTSEMFADSKKSNNEATEDVYVLSAFDPLLIGYEKRSNLILPDEYLRNVFTMQGIINPTILYNGKVNGVWKIKDKKIYVKLFSDMPQKSITKIKDILESVTGLRNIFIDV